MFPVHNFQLRVYKMASDMASILRKLKLNYFIERFSKEEIMPDLIGKLYLH